MGGVPLTSVGVSQSPFLAFPSLLPVAVGSGTRMGKSKDLGGFFFLIYLFIVTFRFLVFGFTGMGGTLPTVPHWSRIPKPCSSPIPTYLSTCIKPPGLGMGEKGKKAYTWRFLTHNHPDQPSRGKRVELSGHGNRSSDFRAGGRRVTSTSRI